MRGARNIPQKILKSEGLSTSEMWILDITILALWPRSEIKCFFVIIQEYQSKIEGVYCHPLTPRNHILNVPKIYDSYIHKVSD